MVLLSELQKDSERLTIFLAFYGRIVYKRTTKLERVLFGRQRNPQRTLEQLLCGFFYQASRKVLPRISQKLMRMLGRIEKRGIVAMKVFNTKARKLEKDEPTHDPFNLFPKKIPCEGNCPHMVVTDTLNCQKELEGLADMEEARTTGKCPFWPHKEEKTE